MKKTPYLILLILLFPFFLICDSYMKLVESENGTVYPNPYRPLSGKKLIITVPYSHNTIEVFNAEGHFIKRIIKSTNLIKSDRYSWNGTDLEGLPAESGIYLIYIKSTKKEQVITFGLYR